MVCKLGLNRQRGVQIETETLSNRAKPQRLRNKKLGAAQMLGPEDRSTIETRVPSHVQVEPIEPRPTLSRQGLQLGSTSCLALPVYCGLTRFIHGFCRVKGHHNLLHHSPRLKKTSVRQVVLDK